MIRFVGYESMAMAHNTTRYRHVWLTPVEPLTTATRYNHLGETHVISGTYTKL